MYKNWFEETLSKKNSKLYVALSSNFNVGHEFILNINNNCGEPGSETNTFKI
jgi:hypothetical protein